MQIGDLITDYTLPQWQDFPDIAGFRVQVQLPDQAIRVGLWAESQGDMGRLRGAKLLAQYAVADWQGLTVAGLRKLVEGQVRGEDSQEIPYSPENAEMLVKFSAPFFVWLLEQINQRERAAREEAAELKN